MDILANLATGFATALSPLNLLYCFLGVLLGTLVGVLPGLGPVATIAMLLPATFTLPPESALIMLAGIYYGAQYGGSTTAILINLPGESSSVVTALDGYRMAQQGRAGAALATAAIGSFFAGTVATFVIAFLAPPLAALALAVPVAGVFLADGPGPGRLRSCWRRARSSRRSAWWCSGSCSGWSAPTSPPAPPASPSAFPSLPTASTSSSSPWAYSASPRSCATSRTSTRARSTSQRIGGLMPTREDWKRMVAPILRGTALGSLLGILPGGGALLGLVRRLFPGEEGIAARRRVRQGRDRGRGGTGSRPTTPARRHPSSRCSRSASPPTRSWR